MNNQFKALCLSHEETPVNVRELFFLNEKECRNFLKLAKENLPFSEFLVLSTCNRTEIYYEYATDQAEKILKLLSICKNIKNISDYRNQFSVILDQEEAVRHLFEVSVGLKSSVIGDMQIPKQVKDAYQWSADENLAGPFIHRLMHTIFYTHKRVAQETAFLEGAASVSYAAANLVHELSETIKEPTILIIGLGEMGEDVCRNLSETGNKKIYVSNRTPEKAKLLEQECKISVIDFKEVLNFIPRADVIISSLSVTTPLITKKSFSNHRVLTHKYFIDLSVPRSIEPEVEEIPGVLLYNIDYIKARTDEAQQRRLKAIPSVKNIISEECLQFGEWSKEMEFSPVIQKLKSALENIRQDEISKFTRDLTAGETEKIDMITRNIMQKIIKLPVLQLKAACKRDDAKTLIDVLNDLFDLEKTNQTEGK
ncbi:MAG: glutamyl-tRNA reductase [Bacteroidetes bacterium RIFCSPLOWO2_02_FULL_36_8]|nr:MAG: glutamyl-tRNA reductase [Bacteroidetes bacterium RIFCSPLOWO2_02_FULL_36_8]OFY70207.1 MAG: glutamyl-tRNA reductase [Bacteroidetes bacterium RIFCSPLOWO2_12_FULL_37_12]